MNEKLTRDEALRLHRQMWTDMQKALGNNPEPEDREEFKKDWCEQHFPGESVGNHCFLCEYADGDCEECPIEWPNTGRSNIGFYCCSISCTDMDESSYSCMPISRLLALPERSTDEQE